MSGLMLAVGAQSALQHPERAVLGTLAGRHGCSMLKDLLGECLGLLGAYERACQGVHGIEVLKERRRIRVSHEQE
jgi:hypothetical protein